MPGPLSHPKEGDPRNGGVTGKTAVNRVRGTLDRWHRNRVARTEANKKRASGR